MQSTLEQSVSQHCEMLLELMFDRRPVDNTPTSLTDDFLPVIDSSFSLATASI